MCESRTMATCIKWKHIKIHLWNIAKHVNWYFVFAVIMLSLALIMGTAVFLSIDTNHQLNPLDQFQCTDHINHCLTQMLIHQIFVV